MASFEHINYGLRANKSIERKMICEAFLKLSYISDLKNYRYIGFGSTYFTDFILFHKHLGLTNMISIESEEGKKLRMEFNKPFSCIAMKYGTASTILPNLELNNYLNLIWLDYDGIVGEFLFSDIDSVVLNAKAGSMFLVSVNTEPYIGSKDDRMKFLVRQVGKERIPSEYSDVNFSAKNYALVVYDMIDRQIKKTVLERTGGDSSKLMYKQLFHYIYKDGAQMLTVGGILYDEKQKKEVSKMKFEDIKHISMDETPVKIKCPNLTYKEVHHLNNLLPCDIKTNTAGMVSNIEFQELQKALNASDIINFADVYRYYPNFAEANL